MLEIYNEEYKDLLGKTLPAGKKHQVDLSSVRTLLDLCWQWSLIVFTASIVFVKNVNEKPSCCVVY